MKGVSGGIWFEGGQWWDLVWRGSVAGKIYFVGACFKEVWIVQGNIFFTRSTCTAKLSYI